MEGGKLQRECARARARARERERAGPRWCIRADATSEGQRERGRDRGSGREEEAI